MDIETLINAQYNIDICYGDTADADYTTKRKEHQAWVEVSKILFEDYDISCVSWPREFND
jgi:hypothetical protein